MSINIRQKGAEGEREIYRLLNPAIQHVMTQLGYPQDQIDKAATCVQRNQNQTAVGGNDLVGTFGLSIEVKRQEALSVNTWWKQCVDAAARNNEQPVLMYRQNGKKWRVVTYSYLPLPVAQGSALHQVRSEFSMDEFLEYFKVVVYHRLLRGEGMRV